MLEVTEIENIDKEYHWVLKLTDYPSHPLQELIKQFTPQARELFQSSYLYIGELLTKNNNKKTICIFHYHSDLNGPMKFMNMQNLESYKCIFDLNSREITNLACDITRNSVIFLGNSDALSSWHLNKIYKSHYFYIVDETGFAKAVNWN